MAIEKLFPSEGHYEPGMAAPSLPGPGQSWDILVIRERDFPEFPGAVGRVLGKVDEYVIVSGPR